MEYTQGSVIIFGVVCGIAGFGLATLLWFKDILHSQELKNAALLKLEVSESKLAHINKKYGISV